MDKEKQAGPIRFQFTTLNRHTVSVDMVEHGSAEGVRCSSPVVRVENLGIFFVKAIIKEHHFGVSSYDCEPYRFVKFKKSPSLDIIFGPYVVITVMYLFFFFERLNRPD